jgi:Ca2+-binding RTX toxin-like protein
LTIDGDSTANDLVMGVELSGGVLYANATDGGVYFLDSTHKVVAAQVEQLNVNGLGGNDTIHLAFVDDWSYPELEQDSDLDWDVIVEGGSGADKITGSLHNDRLYASGLITQDQDNDLIIGGYGRAIACNSALVLQ